jgi:arginase
MRVTLFVVPYDSGHLDVRMGAGPRHLVAHGLPERLAEAGHEVEIPEVLLPEGFHTEVTAGVTLMRRTAEAVREVLERGRFPVVLSGNCGVCLGLATALGTAGSGMLWFDAHGDLNTPETTPTGFFDGMGYAMLLGHGWRQLADTVPGFAPLAADHAALLGARDLDPGERDLIDRTGVLHLPPAALRGEEGRAALAELGRRVERVHVHVDPDVFEPSVLRGNYLPVPGGLEPSEVIAAAGVALREAPLAGISIGSYDPGQDDPATGPRVLGEVVVGLLATCPG